jgi:hypothetical protein
MVDRCCHKISVAAGRMDGSALLGDCNCNRETNVTIGASNNGCWTGTIASRYLLGLVQVCKR